MNWFRTHHLLLWLILIGSYCEAQYKGDHIAGTVGLESGSQGPPGIYVGNLLWVYPTSTIKDANGNSVNQRGSLTSTLDGIVLSAVTNYKFLGANYGATVVLPFIQNRIQLNSLDSSSGFAYTDMIVTPVSLGWHLQQTDVTALYNIYIPTGKFDASGHDNSGLGMVGNEFSLGSTHYFDPMKSWNLAGTFSLEFHTDKSGTDINVGDLATVEYGFGKKFYKKVSGPIPMVMNVGAAGYAQFKVTGDSGSDVLPALRGFKDRVFALGPEFDLFIPKPRLSIVARYEPEFGARVRTQGQTIVFSLAWVAKSLVKVPPQPPPQPLNGMALHAIGATSQGISE